MFVIYYASLKCIYFCYYCVY